MTRSHYTKLAREIAMWLAGASKDGRTTPVTANLFEAFADEDRAALEMALVELGYDGLVMLGREQGSGWAHPLPQYGLFALADPAVTGHFPSRDAATLARRLLDDTAYASVPALFATTGWSHRRFNPALGLLLGLFGDDRYTMSADSGFAADVISVGEAEQFKLRRFIKENG
jgi:hypothetical protein